MSARGFSLLLEIEGQPSNMVQNFMGFVEETTRHEGSLSHPQMSSSSKASSFRNVHLFDFYRIVYSFSRDKVIRSSLGEQLVLHNLRTRRDWF
jgi:hypothetical protein